MKSKISNTKTQTMKTAMQQLLDSIEATINNDPANDIGIGQAIGLKLVKASIENEWLEAEKEQILEAYEAGHVDGYDLGKHYEDEIYPNSSYYTQTFKSDE